MSLEASNQHPIQKLLLFGGSLALWNQLEPLRIILKGSHLMSDHFISKTKSKCCLSAMTLSLISAPVLGTMMFIFPLWCM